MNAQPRKGNGLGERIAVVTSYSHGYDVLESPRFPGHENSGAHFYVFTNLPRPQVAPWQAKCLPQISASTKRNILFIKTHLLNLLPNFDAYIWHDARLRLEVPPEAIVGVLPDGAVATFKHPRHETLLGEISEIRSEQLVPRDELDDFESSQSLSDLTRIGHSETNLIAFRRGEEVGFFFKEWWRAIESSPARCQLTFDKVAHETSTGVLHLDGGLDASKSRLVTKGKHSQPRARLLVSSAEYVQQSIPHSPDRAAANLGKSSLQKSERLARRSLSTAVIIPISGRAHHEHAAIASVLESDFRGSIHCVLNGACEHLALALKQVADDNDRVTIHSFVEPLGFAGACNVVGLEVSEDLLLFLNSDALVPSQWCETLTQVFEDPNVATAGAIGFNTGDHSLDYPRNFKLSNIDRNSWNELQTFGRAWQALNGVIEVRAIHGSAFAIRRSCFLANHGFNGGAFPQGYGEEVDLCLRLYFQGLKNVALPSFPVIHVGNATYGQSREALQASGRQVLREAYGTRLIESLTRDIQKNSFLQLYRRDAQWWSWLQEAPDITALIFGSSSTESANNRRRKDRYLDARTSTRRSNVMVSRLTG